MAVVGDGSAGMIAAGKAGDGQPTRSLYKFYRTRKTNNKIREREIDLWSNLPVADYLTGLTFTPLEVF